MRTPLTHIASILAAVAVAASCAPSAAETTSNPTPPTQTPRVGCATPAPDSAEGYAALWATIPTAQWGAADVNLSVPLPDGRVLWLYGDTFSEGRFVHSSAIVQDGGCLHVANGGEQIVPNVKGDWWTMSPKARDIFWIVSAEVDYGNVVVIQTRSIKITDPKNPWGFKDGGYTQLFRTEVDEHGDLVGLPERDLRTLGDPKYRTMSKVTPVGPALDETVDPKYGEPDPGPMTMLGAHHVAYGERTHPWAKMASGKTLTSINQNWDDGVLHRFPDYRPIWSER